MRIPLTALLIASAVGCAQVPPEKRMIEDAASALGGRDRLLAAKTIVIEGEGPAPNVGQNTLPDSDLPVWKVTELKRTIDLAGGRMRTQQLRTAQFQFAGATVQRQDQSVDGDVAYNSGPGSAARAGEAAARDRRVELRPAYRRQGRALHGAIKPYQQMVKTLKEKPSIPTAN